MTLETLPNRVLLADYTDMVKWYHYDPMCTDQPSEFSLDELEGELARRLDAGFSQEPESDED